MSDQRATYKAGAASVCITPDEPLWLAGYAVRTAPARGKISDLFASAIAIEDAAGRRFVIAAADVIAITPAIYEPVARAAADRHNLPRSQLLLAPTHTHYGPEYRVDKTTFFNIPTEFSAKLSAVADRLVTSLTQVIDQALANLEPVRLCARTAKADFAHNRRRHGVVGGKASTEDIVDHDVPILDCIDEFGNRKAILFGYACHNTTIPPDDLRYCADWAGFAKERLQQANPGATAIYIPGAGADQDPEPHGSVELSRQHGRQIADAILESLNTPGVEITGPIRAAIDDVELDLTPVTRDSIQKMLESNDRPQQVKGQYLRSAIDRGDKLITSYKAPVEVLRLGDELLLIALSGEPVIDWAHKFKQPPAALIPSPQLPAASPLTWVAGYCNDMFGYLPTRRVQAEGGYEAGRANLWSWIPAPFTDDVEDRITDAVQKLVERVGAGDWGLGEVQK